MFMREIFKEHYDVTDSIAKNILITLQPELEKELGITFRGSHLHGRSRIAPYMRRRHPQSILEKPNPFISVGFTTDVEDQDGTYSSSSFRTDVSTYIDPKEYSDILVQNFDKRVPERDIEIRLVFDNVNMNCDIALIFDTPARQTQCKRVWGVLYETAREYEVNMTVKAPISKNILIEWSRIFELDINDLDSVLEHMQQRSEFLMTREVRGLTGEETLYFHYQCRARLKYDRIESSNSDEHGNTAMSRVLARLLNIRFNSPSLYYLVDKSSGVSIPIGNGEEDKVEIVETGSKTSLENRRSKITVEIPGPKDEITKTDNIIAVDGGDNMIDGMLCVYHNKLLFDKPFKNIYNTVSAYNNFLDWYHINNNTYMGAVKVLIRDVTDTANKDSNESSSDVSIGYRELTLRLNNKNLIDKPFDLKIFLDHHIHSMYMDYKSKKESVHDHVDVIDIATGTGTEDILSEELKAFLDRER